MNPWDILDGYGGEPVIAVRPSLIRLYNPTIAIFLSQALFYQQRWANDKGWFEVKQSKFTAETGLSDEQQKTARTRLVADGILFEQATTGNRLQYQIQAEILAKKLLDSRRNSESENHEIRNPRTTESENHGIRGSRILESVVTGKLESENHGFSYNKDLNPSLRSSSETPAGGITEKPELSPSELEAKALQQLRSFSNFERSWLQHWTQTFESKMAAFKILAFSPAIFKKAVDLAKYARAAGPTFRQWAFLFAEDVENSGHAMVEAALTETLITPLESPRNAFTYYKRVLGRMQSAPVVTPVPSKTPSVIGLATTPQTNPFDVLLAQMEGEDFDAENQQ